MHHADVAASALCKVADKLSHPGKKGSNGPAGPI